jgi:hypothetical protein
MAVKPSMIENREQDLTVEHRTIASGGHVPTAEDQLRALRQRIRAAVNQVGTDPSPKGSDKCDGCFQRGWMTLANQLLIE